MATPVDARAICDPSQLKDLEELAAINEKIKVLEGQKQGVVAKVKKTMNDKNLSALALNGNTFTLVESQRKTVTKSTKDQFIAELVSHGLRHLVKTSIEPDVDGILAEVDAGNLEQAMVNRYMKVTPVVTLRVT